MKILVAPDKFKGSLPATQVAAAIAAGLHAGRPGAEVVTIPVADGGEGTVDAAVAAGSCTRNALQPNASANLTWSTPYPAIPSVDGVLMLSNPSWTQ